MAGAPGDYSMRVLLRHAQTGAFYQSAEHWVERAEDAWDFKSSASALQLVSEMKLEGVDIVFWFDDPRYNMILPIKLLPRAGQP